MHDIFNTQHQFLTYRSTNVSILNIEKIKECSLVKCIFTYCESPICFCLTVSNRVSLGIVVKLAIKLFMYTSETIWCIVVM